MRIEISDLGAPLPLGVSKRERGYNFALFSKNASAVYLDLFLPGVERSKPETVKLDPQKNRTGHVWHIQISGLPDHFYYSYHIDGPRNIQAGHIYDIQRELIDPYAKALLGMEQWRVRTGKSRQLLGQYREFSYDWGVDQPPAIPQKDLIIYEAHVRGFTRNENSGVQFPGTYKGFAEKLEYLSELGINAIEFLPVQEFDEIDCDYRDPDSGQRLTNYWGYDSLNYFSLKTAYSSCENAESAMIEFKNLVKSCHQRNMEVILDVVFNHTGEGDASRSVVSFKGIDNQVYYMRDETGEYLNYSGCGNSINANHPVVTALIIDTLRYWVLEYHIDGFRFDLASVLTRDANGAVLSDPPLIKSIAEDPVLADVKIIAEAWDASGLYQVGAFPAYGRWLEWNGPFRDVTRRFIRGEPGLSGEMATRIAGSEDLYGPSGRLPSHSVNFITAHDGFSMLDLVSYNHKHNTANGEGNRDGTNENYSENHGVEGPSADPSVNASRLKQIRNMAAIMMLSQGVPMIRAGDEFGQTQQGNNNAWCQDNEISWLDWDLLQTNNELFEFWKAIIGYRKQYVVFRRDAFFTGEIHPESGLPDISWHGEKPNQPDFGSESRFLAFMIDDTDYNQAIYFALNFHDHALEVELPSFESPAPWKIELMTDSPDCFVHADRTGPRFIYQANIRIPDRSIWVLKRDVGSEEVGS